MIQPQIYLTKQQSKNYCKETKWLIAFWKDVINFLEKKLDIENEKLCYDFSNLSKIYSEEEINERYPYYCYENLIGQALNWILQFFDQEIRSFILNEMQSDNVYIHSENEKNNEKEWVDFYDFSLELFVSNIKYFDNIKNILIQYDLDIEKFYWRSRMGEIFKIANIIKHGQWESSRKLKKNNYKIKKWSWVKITINIDEIKDIIDELDILICDFWNFITERSYLKDQTI